MLKGSAKKKTLIGGALLAGVIVTLLIVANHRLPTHDGRSVEQWFGELTSEDATVRTKAEEAMRIIGPASIPFLLSQVTSRRPTIKDECIAWVEDHLLKKDIPTCGMVGMSEVWRRQHSLKLAFNLLGTSAAPSVPKLMPLLSDPACQYDAALCLAAIGPEGVVVLGAQLGSTNLNTRLWVVAALGETKNARPEAASLLLTALKDADPMVRHYSASSLGAIRANPQKSIPALISALEDTDSSVRSMSANALGKFESDAIAALEPLRVLTGDPDGTVRKAASAASAAIEGFAKQEVGQ